jgi:precorrin-2 dehydrogenase / sirohydrochlorin ferrochelatase
MYVYPIFLNNLIGRKCVVVGGNHEAERKAGELLDAQADVVLIADEVTAQIAKWDEEGKLRWEKRAYRNGDLKQAFLAIVAVTNPVATAPIWEEAQAEKALINAMDDVQHCTFVAGSIVRRGPLVIAVSTSGCAPALSVRIRQRLESMFDEAYGRFVHLMGRMREPMAVRYPDFSERKQKWYEVVDSDALPLFQAGLAEQAHSRIASIVGTDVVEVLQQEEHSSVKGKAVNLKVDESKA